MYRLIIKFPIRLHSITFLAAIDECSTSGDCVSGTVCINTAEGPGFLCQCPPGFTGDGRRSGDGCYGENNY
jgi:hypothetical protein